MQQYWYWSEGQHGVNTLNADTNPGSATGGVQATSFPTNFASTMTWDPKLMYQETTAISDEIRGFLDPSLWGKAQNNLGPSPSNYGDLTFWAPTVNMDRDPRWGRTDEAFGEDPYLVGQMAEAFVKGYQGETLSGAPLTKYLKVAATAKHYALNNVEDYRTPGGAGTNDEDLRDYYTAQFRDLVENAHVNGIMTSYNAINGTPSVADTYTVNELLPRTYGFDGYTTSDCGAVGHDLPGAPGWPRLGAARLGHQRRGGERDLDQRAQRERGLWVPPAGRLTRSGRAQTSTAPAASTRWRTSSRRLGPASWTRG